MVAALGTLAHSPSAHAAGMPAFRYPLSGVVGVSAYYDHDVRTGAGKVQTATCTTATYDGHTGTDLPTPIGTQVYAAASGGLYYRYNNCPTYGSLASDCGGGYGNHVRIDHEGNLADGQGWVTIYGHMQIDTASYPQSLLCGAKIGKSGSSGRSSGPHLHFEVRKYGYPNNDVYGGQCSSHAANWWTTAPPGTSCPA
jgi:murein DD-endopeptidase MepM/ murein hydrolase activator NlpD